MALKKLKDKVCPICGKTFKPTHSSHKYCSRECSGHAVGYADKFRDDLIDLSKPYTKDDEPWEHLATAIIKQAVKDELRFQDGREIEFYARRDNVTQKETEAFFKSEWFKDLCWLAGDIGMEALSEKVR